MIINFTERQLKIIKRAFCSNDYQICSDKEAKEIFNKINAELITLKHEKLMREKMKENWNCMKEVR